MASNNLSGENSDPNTDLEKTKAELKKLFDEADENLKALMILAGRHMLSSGIKEGDQQQYMGLTDDNAHDFLEQKIKLAGGVEAFIYT